MKCSICHDDLVTPDAICLGTLPGALGLTKFSAGPCNSNAEQRAEVTSRRIEAAKREAERKE
jgi:hypothetical protein